MKTSTILSVLTIGYLIFERKKLLQKLKTEKREILKNLQPIINSKLQDAFNQGSRYNWSLVQVSIYEMYKNMELLDFVSIIESITNKLNKYNQDMKLRDKKIKEYVNTIQGMGFINRTKPDGSNN